MDIVIEFFRAFRQTPETMCCEPVVAWIERGCGSMPYSRNQQIKLWRLGMMRGCALAAQRLGLRALGSDEVLEGDVVLARQVGGSELLGVMAGGGVVVSAAAGVVSMTREPSIIAAWRV